MTRHRRLLVVAVTVGAVVAITTTGATGNFRAQINDSAQEIS